MALTGSPLAQVASPYRVPTVKAWSIACWVKAATTPTAAKYSNVGYINSNAANAVGTLYLTWDNPGAPFSALGVGDGPTYPSVSFGASPALNTWVHLAAVFSGSYIIAYRNGVLLASPGMNVANLPAGISARFANSLPNTTSATVADGGAWNAALTTDEVSAMGIDGVSAGLIRRSALFAFFPLIRDQIDVAASGVTGGVGNTASDHPRIIFP